jgi:hypothetical protein
LVIVLLSLALALGQAASGTNPAAAPAPSGPIDATVPQAAEAAADEGFDEVQTMVIYAEHLAAQARKRVIEEAEALGYRRVIEKNGRTILRHDATWHGEVVLYDDGRVEVKRQPVRFEPPVAKVTPASYLACILVPLCIRPGGQLVSPRRYHQFEREAWTTLSEPVASWNDRIADAAIDVKLANLPERLEGLWVRGEPIEGDRPLSDMPARRRALLDLWDSRTENDWGERIRAGVEAFVRDVVEPSTTPFTSAERDAFESRRKSTRPFPWPPSQASVGATSSP